jgi:hypothetical protein
MEKDPRHLDHGEVPWRAPATPRRRRRKECGSPRVQSWVSVGPGDGGCRGGGIGKRNRPVVGRSSRSGSSEKKGAGGSVLSLLQTRRKEEEEVNGGGWSDSRGALHALGSWPQRQVARGAWRTRGGVLLPRRHVPFTEFLNRGFSSVKPSLTA